MKIRMKKFFIKTKKNMINHARNVFYVLSGLLVSSVCLASGGSDLSTKIYTFANEYIGPGSPLHLTACIISASLPVWKYKSADKSELGVFVVPLVVALGYTVVWDACIAPFF